MYRPHFEAAALFLRNLGYECSLLNRPPVSSDAIASLSASLAGPVPEELEAYLAELGDGFSIQWKRGDRNTDGSLFHAGLSFIEDIGSEHSVMKEDITRIATSPEAPATLRREARRRLAWVPIIGVGEGGYTFCLDPAANINRICYYDIRWATYSSDVWHASIGDSLLDLVRQWSRFCFSNPVSTDGKDISFSILAARLDGPFDWHPSNFSAMFDRGTSKA